MVRSHTSNIGTHLEVRNKNRGNHTQKQKAAGNNQTWGQNQ